MPRSTFRFWFTIIVVPSLLVVGVLGYLAWRQAVPGVRATVEPVPRWIGVKTPLIVDLVASKGGVRSVEIRLRQGSAKVAILNQDLPCQWHEVFFNYTIFCFNNDFTVTALNASVRNDSVNFSNHGRVRRIPCFKQLRHARQTTCDIT